MNAPDQKDYYAHRKERPDGTVHYFHASPRRSWVALFEMPEPIVTVSVRAWREGDAPSSYWGWIATGKDHYTLVWPLEDLLEMCFPMGTAPSEARGEGRKVHLVVTETP